MRTPACLTLLLLALLLGACAKENRINVVDKLPFIYRIDIQQGNLLTEEKIDQIELGMTQEQVVFIMGTPILDNIFNEDVQYYYYSFQAGKKNREQEQLILSFSDNKLTDINHQGMAPDAIPKDTHPRDNILIDDKAIL